MKNITIDAIHWGDFYLDWSSDQGFGQLEIRFDRETGTLEIHNECMSREKVREILIQLVDHIVNNGQLADQPFPDLNATNDYV